MTQRIRKSRAWDVKNKVMILPSMPFIGSGSGALNVSISLDGKILTQSTYDLPLGPLPEFELIWMDWSGFQDGNKKDIFEGDVIEVRNDQKKVVRAICEFGVATRNLQGNDVDIMGFYFKMLETGKKTFPIVSNYAGYHDTEMFGIVGNIFQTEEFFHLQPK